MTNAQLNPNFQNQKNERFGHWDLGLGWALGFGHWDFKKI